MITSSTADVALAHDWLNQAGGAEYVLGVLHDLWPSAPIHTAIYDPARVPEATGWDVRTSGLDRLPGIHARHQPYLPLYPLAWQRCRPRRASGEDHDLVLSNKSGFCHGLQPGRALHVCYCLAPTRFVWQADEYLAYERVSAPARLALRALLPALRRWDYRAAQRVDRFVAISETIRARIARFYDRESEVIHPPLDLSEFAPSGAPPEDFHLVVARLVPYKRIDLAVRAFSRLGRRLVIVGDGRDRARLEELAGPTVRFAGRLPRREVTDLLARSRGLVWPGVEDYGLAPVEAMASGRPVIARRAGGVLDTVVEGETGVFFDEARPEALEAAVRAADEIDWAPARLRARAARFGRDVFERRLLAYVDEALRARAARAETSLVGAAGRPARG